MCISSDVHKQLLIGAHPFWHGKTRHGIERTAVFITMGPSGQGITIINHNKAPDNHTVTLSLLFMRFVGNKKNTASHQPSLKTLTPPHCYWQQINLPEHFHKNWNDNKTKQTKKQVLWWLSVKPEMNVQAVMICGEKSDLFFFKQSVNEHDFPCGRLADLKVHYVTLWDDNVEFLGGVFRS